MNHKAGKEGPDASQASPGLHSGHFYQQDAQGLQATEENPQQENTNMDVGGESG